MICTFFSPRPRSRRERNFFANQFAEYDDLVEKFQQLTNFHQNLTLSFLLCLSSIQHPTCLYDEISTYILLCIQGDLMPKLTGNSRMQSYCNVSYKRLQNPSQLLLHIRKTLTRFRSLKGFYHFTSFTSFLAAMIFFCFL